MLRLPSGADRDWLWALHAACRVHPRFRALGVGLAGDESVRELAPADTLQQSVFQSCRTKEPFGLGVVYKHEPLNRTAHLAIMLVPEMRRRGWSAEAMLLFVDMAFNDLGMRKLYAEIVDGDQAGYPSVLANEFEVEVTYPSYVSVGGQARDLVVAGCSATRWNQGRVASAMQRIRAESLRTNQETTR